MALLGLVESLPMLLLLTNLSAVLLFLLCPWWMLSGC
jgi:hypothetical protein